MKYCPFCGASLVEGAAFCMECGRTIPVDAASAEAQPPRPAKRKRPATRQHTGRPKRPRPVAADAPPSASDPGSGYDGYYDDVLPGDDGGFRERMDKGLVKRIIAVGVVALVLVGLSMVVMRLL